MLGPGADQAVTHVEQINDIKIYTALSAARPHPALTPIHLY